ncbi:MAG TPA: TadE/TadG family type IV pilus assembly protein [Bryobacteraceae bacterium]|nr:TadE/TadG family type IV pilus assembly protein [Bryobacteraceae bacterium]
MVTKRKVSERRRITSSGAQWIELAFVMLPFFALITAFFDVSFVLFSWSTVQNAVREGCRYAITFQTAPPSGATWTCNGHQDNCIENDVAYNSMGLVTVAGGLINVNYYAQATPNTPIASPNGNVPGNIVGVSILSYPLNWMIPLSGTGGGGMLNSGGSPYRPTSPTNINVYAYDILGGYPAGVGSVSR